MMTDLELELMVANETIRESEALNETQEDYLSVVI